jgi:hypothetical protein
LVFRGGGKPHEEPMKSSGAKFISRSQPRTFANASSTSTAQMGVHVGKYGFSFYVFLFMCSSSYIHS